MGTTVFRRGEKSETVWKDNGIVRFRRQLSLLEIFFSAGRGERPDLFNLNPIFYRTGIKYAIWSCDLFPLR